MGWYLAGGHDTGWVCVPGVMNQVSVVPGGGVMELVGCDTWCDALGVRYLAEGHGTYWVLYMV